MTEEIPDADPPEAEDPDFRGDLMTAEAERLAQVEVDRQERSDLAKAWYSGESDVPPV